MKTSLTSSGAHSFSCLFDTSDKMVSSSDLQDILAMRVPNVESVELVGRNIGDEEMRQLCRVIPSLPRLRQLSLSLNNFGPTGVKCLCEALRNNTSVETLDLYCNRQIGDEGAKHIGEMLKTNHTIKRFCLIRANVRDYGAQALFKGLAQNDTVVRVCLIGNRIGDKGARAIGKGFTQNMRIKTLQLYGNRIGDEGARAFGKMLQKNRTIKCFDVRQNQYGDAGERAMAHALKENTTIRINSLGNIVGEKACAEIEDYRDCKKKGSSLLQKSLVPDALWANVLGRMRKEPDLIYHFLKEKPYLIKTTTTENRKRKREAL